MDIGRIDYENKTPHCDGQMKIGLTDMKKLQAKGNLGRLLANIDEQQLYTTEQKMRIAAKIDKALRAQNLSDKDFAQMMGCSVPEVSDILSGTRNLTLDELSDIERMLGIEL